jgi:hypothetical protein
MTGSQVEAVTESCPVAESSRVHKLICRLAIDPSDPVIGMPEFSHWSKELETRLTKGEYKGTKKQMEKQYVPLIRLSTFA